MDRGVWWATIHRVAKESDMTKQLKNSNKKNNKSNQKCQGEVVISHLNFKKKILVVRKKIFKVGIVYIHGHN